MAALMACSGRGCRFGKSYGHATSSAKISEVLIPRANKGESLGAGPNQPQRDTRASVDLSTLIKAKPTNPGDKVTTTIWLMAQAQNQLNGTSQTAEAKVEIYETK
jgi:hypothetical protein